MQTSAFDHVSPLGLPKPRSSHHHNNRQAYHDRRQPFQRINPEHITVPVRRGTWAESDHLTVKKRDVRARMRLRMQVRQVCSAADSILSKLLLVFCHSPQRWSAKDTDVAPY